MIIQPYAGGASSALTSDAIFDALDGIPEMHRNIFRGKNLGSTCTAEQHENLSNGTLHDLWVGDYWEAEDGTKWRIADINNPYYDDINHSDYLYVIPDESLYRTKMYSSSSTKITYKESTVASNIEEKVTPEITKVFNETYITSLPINFVSGSVSGGYGVKFIVPSERMLTGSSVFSSDSVVLTNATIQLALFRLAPKFLIAEGDMNYWLCDVANVDGGYFCNVTIGGSIGYLDQNSATQGGVRPLCAIR